jgi:hypothetical protein
MPGLIPVQNSGSKSENKKKEPKGGTPKKLSEIFL